MEMTVFRGETPMHPKQCSRGERQVAARPTRGEFLQMKTILITAVTVLAFVGLTHAQPPQQESKDVDRSTLQTDTSIQSPQSGLQTNSSGINEPSGAETPRGRAFSQDNPPNGRAFSTNDAPQGRPFQNDSRPPGRPFREPSGSDIIGSRTNSQSSSSSSVGGTNSAAIDQSSSTDIQKEPAGAPRNQSQQLVSAFQSHEKTQIEQAIKANLGSTISAKVPDEFVTRLSGDLSTTLTKVQITEEQRLKLANAINVILTAQPANQVEVQQAFTTVQSTLVPNLEVATPLAQAAVCDLHLIATQLVPGIRLDMAAPTIVK